MKIFSKIGLLFSGKYFPYFFLFILNFTVKFIYIDSQDIAMDEPFSIFYSQFSPYEIINYLAQGNNPPLYELFLHYWTKIFGIGCMSVRFPSVLFDSITLMYIFKICKKHFNFNIAYLSCMIFIFSTMHIYFSHESRVYPCFSLFITLSIFEILNIINLSAGKYVYFRLFLWNVIIMYLHYLGIVFIFTEIICFSVFAGKSWRKLIFVYISIIIFYLPQLFSFIIRINASIEGKNWVLAPHLSQFYGFLNLFLNNRINMFFLIFVFSIALFYHIIRKTIYEKWIDLRNNYSIQAIFICFSLPYVLMFLVSFKFPVFIDRYLLFTSIPFYIIISYLMNFLIGNKIWFGSLSIFFVISIILTSDFDPPNNREMKNLVRKLVELKNENTIVILAPDYADLGFTYHYNLNYFKSNRNLRLQLSNEHVFPISNSNQLDSLFNLNFNYCIYIEAGQEFIDPENKIYLKINEKYKKINSYFIPGIYKINYFVKNN